MFPNNIHHIFWQNENNRANKKKKRKEKNMSDINQRQYERHDVALSVQALEINYSFYANNYITQNVSEGGMFIITESPLQIGEKILFQFRVSDTGELVSGVGEVAWNRRVDDGPGRPKGCGIKFENVVRGKHQLRDYLKTL
jgi:Tfp pilus assembly protein PilZ